MNNDIQLLTNSRAECFKACRRRCFWSYECAIRRDTDAKPLRMGTAYHIGLDFLKTGYTIEEALAAVRLYYACTPTNFDQREWELECDTVAALVTGYEWRWKNAPLNWVASEQSFQVPLVNPATGAKSRLFEFAGKADGIIKLEDGRLAVGEHKLLGNDIGLDSDLWRRLQLDGQISGYVFGGRRVGFQVSTVLYDCARKPTIKPNPIAITDDLGAKIVLDKSGERVRTERGQWRQTGDAAKGYTLQTRDMTPTEWCTKLLDDIGEQPDFYFARVEIPRLDSDIAEWSDELWQLQKSLRDAQVHNRFFKTVSFSTCPFCAYWPLCTMRYQPGDPLPQGFKIVENVNSELGEDQK
jgi:hypothetical protein